MKNTRSGWKLLLVGSAFFFAVGCGQPKPVTDAGTDAGVGPQDSGTTDAGGADAGSDGGTTDAGPTDGGTTDAGTTDAGSTDAGDTDAGSTDAGDTDAGSTDAGDTDAGVTDAGPTPSEQIAAARAAADGTTSLAVNGALVTYLKPLVAAGADPAGFFVQSEQTGPALFVAVDPATLTPVPAVGDSVDFTIDEMADAGLVRQAIAISGFSRASAGNAVTGLVQDLTAATDVVTNVTDYESELITMTGTIAGPFAGSSTGYVAAPFDTTGLVDAGVKLRLPDAVRSSLDLAPSCALSVNSTPMWRFFSTPEPSAWTAGELTVTSCPAPTLVSAVPSAATTVLLNFDRLIEASSVTASGAQFTFDNGLTASAAAVAGKQVTVTTSSQVGGTTYTVNAATSVTDTRGTALDSAAASATFTGFETPAQLVINEVNPNVATSRDLIELLAVSGGSISGFVVEQDLASPITLVTLPALTVATGDLIVVHLNPSGPTTETTSKTQCTNGGCYAGAWDVNGGTTGITYSNRILVVRDALGAIQDAVPFQTGASPAGFPADLQAIQAASQWLPADCGGSPCTYGSTPTAQGISVDWSGLNTTTGKSVERKPGGLDTNQASDWNPGGNSSFGTAN